MAASNDGKGVTLPLQSHGTAAWSRQSVDLHLDTHEVVRPDTEIKKQT
jgi:hypothetical protein